MDARAATRGATIDGAGGIRDEPRGMGSRGDSRAGDETMRRERGANDARCCVTTAGRAGERGGGRARVDARAIARSGAMGDVWRETRAGDSDDDDDARLTDAMMRLARVG